jgi:hypothetical protein
MKAADSVVKSFYVIVCKKYGFASGYIISGVRTRSTNSALLLYVDKDQQAGYI